jgi:hypothetical protein
MPPVLFALVILETGSPFLPEPVWTMILLFLLPTVGGMTGACLLLFPLRWGLLKYFHGLAWDHNPPDLSLPCSWEDSVCHHTQLLVEMGSQELFLTGLDSNLNPLISSSWVPRITSASNQCLPIYFIFILVLEIEFRALYLISMCSTLSYTSQPIVFFSFINYGFYSSTVWLSLLVFLTVGFLLLLFLDFCKCSFFFFW